MVVNVSCPMCHTSIVVAPCNGTHSISGTPGTLTIGPGIMCQVCAHGFAWVNGRAANLNGRSAIVVGTPPPTPAKKDVSVQISMDASATMHDYSGLTYQQLRTHASENGVLARGKRKEIEAELQAADIAPPEPTE